MRATLQLLLVPAVVLGLTAGCDLVGKAGPEEVRLVIEGRPGREVRLITSSFFLTNRIQEIDEHGFAIDSTSVLLIDADTLVAGLPYERTYDIRRDQRFYVRMNRFAPGGDSLFVRMWIDGELKFEKLPPADQDSVQFIYNFRGAPGQDEVEL